MPQSTQNAKALTENANALSNFFHGSEATLGIFYPIGYLMAAFRDLDTARHAAQRLEDRGFSQETLAVEGGEVVALADAEQRKNGLWGLLMKELSRMIATEEVYTDHDLDLAKSGAAFLVVHCPADDRKNEAWKLIEPFDPIVARHYAVDGIEHFRGEV